MSGKNRIPTLSEKIKALGILQGRGLTDRNVVQILEIIRWDPRICEEFVRRLSSDWRNLNIENLFSSLQRSHQRSVFAVAAEFAQWLVPKSERQLFKGWRLMIVPKSQQKTFSVFYLNQFPFASRSLSREAQESSLVFKRWGFLSADPPINKAVFKQRERTALSKTVRAQRLNELLSEKTIIRVEDYLLKLGGLVSRRVAELDLKQSKKLKPIGQTRARRYQLLKTGAG